GDTRPLILAYDLDSFAPAAIDLAHRHGASAGIEENITRQLADRGGDPSLIDCAKAHIFRGITGQGAGNHNIKVAPNNYRLTLHHRHSPRSRAAMPQDPFRG